MKYLYIIANAFTALTGGDRHFIEISKRWQKIDRLKITLVIPWAAKDVCIKEGLDANCIIIPPKDVKKLGIIPTYILRAIFALVKVPKFNKDVIVYSASDCLPDVLPALFTKLLNKNSKWIACSFHLVQHYSRRQGQKVKNIISYYMQRFSIFIVKLADLVIVDNSILKRELNRMGIKEQRIFISSMGIDRNYIDNIKKEDYRYDGCFVGRLHPAKGIFDLINIWSEVVKQKKDAKLSIIGKGDKDIIDKLSEKIKYYSLEKNIDLPGFLDKEGMFKVIKGSRVFIFPSHEEGWGIAIAEAMACGLPVVIYDLPALREVFPQGVIRVRIGDIRKFADETVSLLNNFERYKRLQTEGCEIANRYSWDNVAKKELVEILKLYNEKI